MTKESVLDSLQHQKCSSSPGKPKPARQSTQPLTEGVQEPLLPEESKEFFETDFTLHFCFKIYVYK